GYFDRFTREYLGGDRVEDVTIEVLSPDVGDQREGSDMRLEGVSYDPKSQEIELLLEEAVDHLVFEPTAAWVIEEEGGFVSTLQLVRRDGTREIVYLQRGGPPARLQDSPPAPGR